MNRGYFTNFGKGVIAGALGAIIIICIILGLIHINKKNKERNLYVEKQLEIKYLQENINNLPASDFLELPDVRRAADGAANEFDRRRDEIMERYRSTNNY